MGIVLDRTVYRWKDCRKLHNIFCHQFMNEHFCWCNNVEWWWLFVYLFSILTFCLSYVMKLELHDYEFVCVKEIEMFLIRKLGTQCRWNNVIFHLKTSVSQCCDRFNRSVYNHTVTGDSLTTVLDSYWYLLFFSMKFLYFYMKTR